MNDATDLYFRIYLENNQEWRWQMRLRVGGMYGLHTTLADSREGYLDKTECINMIELIKRDAVIAPVHGAG